MTSLYPGAVTTLLDRELPEAAVPAGYAALIAANDLAVQPPRTLSAIGQRHTVVVRGGWRLLTPRHAPKPSFEGHLTFALKYEGVDLAVFKALFEKIGPAAVTEMVARKPTGRYTRRIWFLYEWLIGSELSLPSLQRGNYVPAIDPAIQFAGLAVNSARHRVRNNLPGTPEFCPLVFKSEELCAAMRVDFPSAIRRVFDETPEKYRPFVWLTFANWEARPQRGIVKSRTVLGLWRTGTLRGGLNLNVREVAVLKEAEETELSIRHPHLKELLTALNAFAEKSVGVLPVPLVAACLAFGFAIGNAETDPFDSTHRYLAQKYFAHNNFRAGDWMVPVSAIAQFHRLTEYRRLLATPYERGLFDATPHVAFYYACIADALVHAVPPAVEAAPKLYERELAMARS